MMKLYDKQPQNWIVRVLLIYDFKLFLKFLKYFYNFIQIAIFKFKKKLLFLLVFRHFIYKK